MPEETKIVTLPTEKGKVKTTLIDTTSVVILIIGLAVIVGAALYFWKPKLPAEVAK